MAAPHRARSPVARLGVAARVVIAAGLVSVAAGCGRTGSAHPPAAAATAPAAVPPSAPASSSRAVAPATSSATVLAPATTTTTTTIDPGLLPQTSVLPSTTDPAFQGRVAGLWQAIVTGDPAPGMPFFFPLSAYRQVKAISDPVGDWQNRLVADYGIDIAQLHRLLGPQPSMAAFVGIQVPTSQAVWVRPGVEDNKGSYYRVYGTRLLYQEGGQTREFPVYSLISWRGEWYVVHLGPIR